MCPSIEDTEIDDLIDPTITKALFLTRADKILNDIKTANNLNVETKYEINMPHGNETFQSSPFQRMLFLDRRFRDAGGNTEEQQKKTEELVLMMVKNGAKISADERDTLKYTNPALLKKIDQTKVERAQPDAPKEEAERKKGPRA